MKFRVIVNKVSFYTNSSSIKRGVGDFTAINNAVLTAFNTLMDDRARAKATGGLTPIGLAMTAVGHEVQIDIL